MGNYRLQALILVHVHNNILDDMNLPDVANQFIDRKDSCKQTFKHISQNYKLIDCHQQMRTVLLLPQNDLI